MYKGSIDKETDIVGVSQGRVDDVISINLQDAPCLKPANNPFEDRLLETCIVLLTSKQACKP